jgi:hypothetical protein
MVFIIIGVINLKKYLHVSDVPKGILILYIHLYHGLCSSVGIETDYRLGGLGIESRWGRGFSPVQTGPGAHPASCTMGTRSFRGVKCGRGVTLTTRPLLALRSWKSRAVPLPPSGPVTGLLYLYIHMYLSNLAFIK